MNFLQKIGLILLAFVLIIIAFIMAFMADFSFNEYIKFIFQKSLIYNGIMIFFYNLVILIVYVFKNIKYSGEEIFMTVGYYFFGIIVSIILIPLVYFFVWIFSDSYSPRSMIVISIIASSVFMFLIALQSKFGEEDQSQEDL